VLVISLTSPKTKLLLAVEIIQWEGHVMRILYGLALTFAGFASGATLMQAVPAAPAPTLTDAYRIIKAHRFVDLTHTFAPGIPHWRGFANERVRTIYWYTPRRGTLGSGFFSQEYVHVGQWGTHVDAPAHFAPGGLTVDRIDPKQMFLPLVVIDVHQQVTRDPDYVISMSDVHAWENAHGAIPPGAFVAMRTDWSKRWPNAAAMQNKDAKGIAHYPGWSMPVLQYLYGVRHVTATGHETTDTDPGTAASHDDYSLESWILHHGHYQIEMLTNLDKVPDAGSLAIVTFPKPGGGSGFPARVIAIVP
jgi:kynurenine formamidase